MDGGIDVGVDLEDHEVIMYFEFIGILWTMLYIRFLIFATILV